MAGFLRLRPVVATISLFVASFAFGQEDGTYPEHAATIFAEMNQDGKDAERVGVILKRNDMFYSYAGKTEEFFYPLFLRQNAIAGEPVTETWGDHFEFTPDTPFATAEISREGGSSKEDYFKAVWWAGLKNISAGNEPKDGRVSEARFGLNENLTSPDAEAFRDWQAHLAKFVKALTMEDYASFLQKKGYSTEFSVHPLTRNSILTLQRLGKTEEGFGLLNIRWDRCVTWKFKYLSENGERRLVDAESIREIKAPLLGRWEKDETATMAPPADFPIVKKMLRSPSE